ncbi:type VII secretion target [Kitasatospora sp. NPDC008050]|uniref:type VII secretion target n=1 Tax=Kitasatospora sp. NPDC008050 TaxID=3364021 RepID=UPI0036E20646
MADDGFKVTTDTLRKEAGIWDQQSDQLGKINASVGSMATDRIQAGVFQIMVSAYMEVVNAVQGRTQEGQTNLKGIANGLRKVADSYDHTEQQNKAAVSGIGTK